MKNSQNSSLRDLINGLGDEESMLDKLSVEAPKGSKADKSENDEEELKHQDSISEAINQRNVRKKDEEVKELDESVILENIDINGDVIVSSDTDEADDENDPAKNASRLEMKLQQFEKELEALQQKK